MVHWKSPTAGASEVCEHHYREYNRKFKHLITKVPPVAPDQRFADRPPPPKSDESDQLEL